MSYNIHFVFEDKSIPDQILSADAGETILEIAMDHDIDLHHNCGGVCACTTCHVYIQQGMEYLSEITDKEEDFIDRANNPRLNSRLACQCEIQGNITVVIPDQRQFLGH